MGGLTWGGTATGGSGVPAFVGGGKPVAEFTFGVAVPVVGIGKLPFE